MSQPNRSNNDKLTSLEIAILVSSTIVGVGVIDLPRSVTNGIGAAGFLSVMLGGIVVLIAVGIIATLSNRFPRQTLVEFTQDILGTWLGKGLILLYLGYFILLTALITRFFGDALKAFFLYRTPVEVVTIFMLLVVVYLIQHGINAIARVSEAFFLPVILIVFLFLGLGMNGFEVQELYPAFQVGVLPVLEHVPKTIMAYLGFEILLFMGPFMKNSGDMRKYGALGVLLPIVIYGAVVALTIGNLTVATLQYTLYPTLTLAKAVDFPGGFAERFDLFFFAFWILAVFTTIAAYYYLSVLTLTRVLNLRNYVPFIYLLLPLIYFVSIQPQNLVEVEQWIGVVGRVGGVFAIIIPLVLLVIAILRGKGVGTRAKKQS